MKCVGICYSPYKIDPKANQLYGFGINFLYPRGTTNVTFERNIQAYADVLQNGTQTGMYVYKVAETYFYAVLLISKMCNPLPTCKSRRPHEDVNLGRSIGG